MTQTGSDDPCDLAIIGSKALLAAAQAFTRDLTKLSCCAA